MGSGPKKSDYVASPAEQASAAVAMAENKYFKEKYDPLLQNMRDSSLKDDSADVLRGRANADTMQTLASGASYDRAATAASGGEEAQAYQAQLAQADKAGLTIKNNAQLGVLGTARGQAADAQTGMTAAGSMGASRVLTKADASQTKRSAKTAALGQIGTSLILQGGKNMKTGGKTMFEKDAKGNDTTTPMKNKDGSVMKTEKGSFFAPRDEEGNSVTGFGARLNYGGMFSTDPY